MLRIEPLYESRHVVAVEVMQVGDNDERATLCTVAFNFEPGMADTATLELIVRQIAPGLRVVKR